METYYIKTTDTASLQDALGRMVEFAMFMAKESGSQERVDYIKEMKDDDILWEVEN